MLSLLVKIVEQDTSRGNQIDYQPLWEPVNHVDDMEMAEEHIKTDRKAIVSIHYAKSLETYFTCNIRNIYSNLKYEF